MLRALLDKFTGAIAKRQFVRNVALVASGTLTGQLLVWLTMPVVSRLFTVEDFGTAGVYLSILMLAAVVGCLRYELAIPIPEKAHRAANLLAICLIVILGTSAIGALLVYFLGDLIVQWTKSPGLRPYMWLLPLGLLGAGIYNAFNYWAIRGKAFGRIAQTTITRSLGQVVVHLVLGLLKLGPIGLILGFFFGQVGGSSTLATYAWRHEADALRRITWQGIREEAWRYRKFPLFASPSGLLNSAPRQIPLLLLAGFYGEQVAGWFFFAWRMVHKPVTLLGMAISQVYYAEAAVLAREAPRKLQRLFYKLTLRLLLIGLAPALLLFWQGPALFSWVFGAAFREAGVYAQILAVVLLAEFIVSSVSPVVVILERQDWQLYGDAVRSVIIIGSLLLAGFNHMPSRTAVAVFAAGMLLTYAGFYVLFAYSIRCRIAQPAELKENAAEAAGEGGQDDAPD